MSKKFLRQDYMRHIKLGKHRKKLLKWRKPKGRHSKMRRQRKGYPTSPSIGYKSPRKISGRINGQIPVLVSNLKELFINKNSLIIISKKLGARKRIEMLKKADEMKIKILNVQQEANQ